MRVRATLIVITLATRAVEDTRNAIIISLESQEKAILRSWTCSWKRDEMIVKRDGGGESLYIFFHLCFRTGHVHLPE